MIVDRGRVDSELAPQRIAEQVEVACVNAVTAAVLTGAGPRDPEIPSRIDSHDGINLIAQRRSVDLERSSQGRTVGGIALSENTPAAAVLILARPSHDRGSQGRHPHRAVAGLLNVRGRGIHQPLGPQLDGHATAGRQRGLVGCRRIVGVLGTHGPGAVDRLDAADVVGV